MKKIWIVAKNELIRYFVSPLAYVYLISFLVLNGSFAVYFGDFINRGQADLFSMFEFQPWIFLLFITGISMRLWAEEFRNNTIVQIITMPVSVTQLVLGKFFASWIFCGIALLLTATFWISVNILGNPDNGVIMLGYLASFVLAGCMIAISQTMSALTKNQVIALVLAVIANLFFFWSGIEYILSVFRLFLPDAIIDVIASFSFINHFDTLSRGLLELRDVVFFTSIICFFNFTTILIINFRTAGTSGWLKSNKKGYYITSWLMLLFGFFGLNILANNLSRNIRFDATQEKIFTLTENTETILKNLPEPVLAKLYFSPILEQRNSNLRNMFDNIRILLQKYKDASDGKFDYKIYNPDFLSEDEDIAIADGLQPIPLIDLNQNALFGLTVEDTLQNKKVIPFFAQERFSALEQDITSKIYQMYHKKKTIGVLSGLPVFGTTSDDGAAISAQWKIVDLVLDTYNIVNITKPDDFAKKFDALVIISPFGVDKEFSQKIKEYSKNNGKILLILDPANESERLYSLMNNRLNHSDLGDLEKFWGIKFYSEYVVADLLNSVTVDATDNYKTNPTFTQDIIQFKIKPNDMNPNHPVSKNLNEIMFASAGVIMPDAEAFKNKKVDFVPLIKAGDISQLMTTKVVVDGLNPREILHYFQPDDNQKFIAAEVKGLEKNNPFDMIVIGDSDFIYDRFWATQKSLLESEYLINTFDNADFILNSLDYLTENFDLIALRGKQQKDRSFKDLENMRRINSLQFSQQEQKIFEKIELAKKGLDEVWNKKNFEGRDTFSADELAAIAKVRQNLNELKNQLGDIRMNAYAGINRVSNIATFFNIFLLPLIFAVVLLMVTICKLLRQKKALNFGFAPDKKLLKLGAICIAVFALGAFSVYMVNKSSVDAYYGKKVFPEISEKINNINTIKLTTNKNTLTFSKNYNLWVLQEFPDLPVYQERIRYLLTTLSDATFFARKSNKAENLRMFHLTPIEDKNSLAMEISLSSAENTIQEFELGDINVDLGRGAKAAYIKFPNQFQVWEIKADFIDMNADWRKWTYSNLWDLRYGRLSTAEHIKDENSLLLLVKYLLNTEIKKVEPFNVTEKPIISSTLFAEDNNSVTLSFYQTADKSFVTYEFDDKNQNKHLQLLAKYLTGKAVVVSENDMEKILEQFERK